VDIYQLLTFYVVEIEWPANRPTQNEYSVRYTTNEMGPKFATYLLRDVEYSLSVREIPLNVHVMPVETKYGGLELSITSATWWPVRV